MYILSIFHSEWIKTRRSLAVWLISMGALCTPCIIFAARLYRAKGLPVFFQSPHFWQATWNQAWEAVAFMILPMGIVMTTGLIMQLEWRNNAWKQVLTTPQSLTMVFCMKLLITLVMLIQFFIAFNLCLYGFALLPLLVVSGTQFPAVPYPLALFLQGNINFFLDCLPIVGLQFALNLHYRNFLVPLGVGFMLWVISIGMMSWEYSYIMPYLYNAYEHATNGGIFKNRSPIDIHILSVGYFVVFTGIGYVTFLFKKEKG